MLIDADQLDDHLLGKYIRYDGDAPTIYGGKHPHPDGQDGHLLITLDGRLVEGWGFDYVWVDNPPVDHQMVQDDIGHAYCFCGKWTPKLGESIWRSFDKHLIEVQDG